MGNAIGQATNQLGQLFVDLGVSGLGKTLKALNSVSATFLLTKNAAQQAIQPIINMSKEGGQLVTALDKINSVTGLSIQNLQGIRNWAKLNNVSFESLVGSIESVQQSLMDIRLGKGLNKGYQLLGIEAWQLDPKDPLKALDLIQAKLKQVNEVTGATALRELGMNTDLAYTFKQADKPISEVVKQAEKLYNISENQTKELQEQQKYWNDINVAAEKIKLNIASWDINTKVLKEARDLMQEMATKGISQTAEDRFNNSKPNYEIIKDTSLGALKTYAGWELKGYTSPEEKKRQAEERIGYKRIGETSEYSDFDVEAVRKAVSDAKVKGSNQTAENNTMGVQSLNNDIIPHLPNVAPSAVNNNTQNKSINYQPTYNLHFDVMGDGSAEQAKQIQDAIISQQDLTFAELLNMAGN